MSDVGTTLSHIFVVVVLAKLAAEVAERIALPIVVAEIVAGIIIGPSLLDLVGGDEVLRVLGELGVVLLLLEVGLEMELVQLIRVGRASLLVATIGVALPFAGGYAAGIMFGESQTTAIFLGASLTATSVGITARVFSELRALARIEARTVLGAAVADDVLGLVILTVVMKIVTEGSVSPLQVVAVLALAVLFLGMSLAVGRRLGPPLFATVRRVSRSSGTSTALSLGFALGFAVLAGAAGLAPIVGAFVAGLSIAGSDHAERMRRELAPLGHIFIPVFFLQIGIDARIGEFLHPSVLALGGVLLLVAITGKLLAAAGALGSSGDKVMIGLGMIPRGEVGLIFAGLGLRSGVLGPESYAALLLVVLATTLMAPPLLRRRLVRLEAKATAVSRSRATEPSEGWLHRHDGVVDLSADPPQQGRELEVLLGAALLVTDSIPGSRLLDWIASLRASSLSWEKDTTRLFFEVLERGNVRSWRLLETSGALDRALPELADAFQRRRSERSELDPAQHLRLDVVDRVKELVQVDPAAALEFSLLDPRPLFLSALVLEVAAADDARVPKARKLVQRLGLGAKIEQDVALLVGSDRLLRAAAERSDATSPEAVLKIATHLGGADRERALFLLSLAQGDLDFRRRARLEELHRMILQSFAVHLVDRSTRNALERKKSQALAGLEAGGEIAERIQAAPRGYALSVSTEDMIKHARLLDPLPAKGRVRIAMVGTDDGRSRIDIATRDRAGLLGWTTQVLESVGFDVAACVVATWNDGGAIQSFEGRIPFPLNEADLVTDLERAIGSNLKTVAAEDVALDFDDDGSPWYTICNVAGPDRPGLLHALAAAMTAAGAVIHSARATTVDGQAIDVFELTSRDGSKLSPVAQQRIRDYLETGVDEDADRSRPGARIRALVFARSRAGREPAADG